MRNFPSLVFIAFSLLTPLSLASAQQGYEFEVYDTHLARPGTTEFELNANFVASGQKQMVKGLFPTHHMLRSSFEIGRGLRDWLEASVYVLGVHQPGIGSSYVGNRVRVTASAPASWNLPLEFGLTQEIGYARPGFAENRWTYEVSPMIGRTWGPVSFALNPAFERSWLANLLTRWNSSRKDELVTRSEGKDRSLWNTIAHSAQRPDSIHAPNRNTSSSRHSRKSSRATGRCRYRWDAG